MKGFSPHFGSNFLALVIFLSLSHSLEARDPRVVPVQKISTAHLLWVNPVLHFATPFEFEILKAWAVQRSASHSREMMIVPVQTGRALLATNKFNLRGDVLVKGTGFNDEPEMLKSVARIRYEPDTKKPTPGDGFFTLRESFVDRENSEILKDSGVVVPKPVAIFSSGQMHPQSGAEMGIYVREFVNQTRFSNLDVMSDGDAKSALEDAAERLYRAGQTEHRLNMEELYFFLMKRMAMNVAILQKLGYQHNYLHWQQVTLAGELADLGTGSWLNTNSASVYQVARPLSYYAFKDQPLIVMNMFTRTHSILAEGGPQPLAEDSETRLLQKNSLLGVIKRIDPEVSDRIEKRDPQKLFWEFYEEAERSLGGLDGVGNGIGDRFSASLSDFLKRHRLKLSPIEQVRIRREFEMTKTGWKVDLLPDSYVFERFIPDLDYKIPRLKGSQAATSCGNGLKNLSTVSRSNHLKLSE